MVEKFDKPKTKKDLKTIASNIHKNVEAYNKGGVFNATPERKAKIERDYEKAINLEEKAQEAGHAKASSSTMKKELDKIKKDFGKYTKTAGKENFKQHQSDQAHKTNQQKAEAFRSGATAAARKQRQDDYRAR